MNESWPEETATNTRQRECSWPGNLPLREVRRAGSRASNIIGEYSMEKGHLPHILRTPLVLKRKKMEQRGTSMESLVHGVDDTR